MLVQCSAVSMEILHLFYQLSCQFHGRSPCSPGELGCWTLLPAGSYPCQLQVGSGYGGKKLEQRSLSWLPLAPFQEWAMRSLKQLYPTPSEEQGAREWGSLLGAQKPVQEVGSRQGPTSRAARLASHLCSLSLLVWWKCSWRTHAPLKQVEQYRHAPPH